MQKQKNRAKSYSLGKVVATVVLLAAIAFVLVGNCAYYFYDAGRLDLPICTLSVPDGWIGEVQEDFNGDEQPLLLLFEGKIEVLRSVCELESSSGCLAYQKGLNSRSVMSKKGVEFLTHYEPQETSRTIDGKNISILRYRGPYYFGNDGQEMKARVDIVTIHFFTDDGIFGSYIGFPEEEHEFWSMIDTIKWKI